jgi:PAS domain S-box-containing protein
MAERLDGIGEQRRYYESLIAVSPTAIVTADAHLHVTSWNPAAETLFGYTAAEAIGMNVDDLVCNDEQVRSEGLELNRLALEGPIQRFTRRTRRDGTLVDVSLRAAAIVVDGAFAGLYAFYDEITELVRRRRYFESLLETSPAAVIMVDQGTIVTSWNPAAEELFGYSATEALGAHLDDLVANRAEVREEAPTVHAGGVADRPLPPTHHAADAEGRLPRRR